MTADHSMPSSIKLICPTTQQSLSPAPSDIIERLNNLIESKELKFVSGEPVVERIANGLVSSDNSVFYPERSGIQVLLADCGIHVTQPNNP